ncbi:hypothetical protein GLYMA_08G330100v4 [Glycine max]|uniref:Nudix hydrolase domain-containing protein n=1 Tax=Glycine max TaxID=3847 RepID=A0A0R0IVX3_SOYBN|nr:nudix hydrolase 10 isoform X5 [Glycine max]KAH1054287.1 hypothetical protein GYH30_023181 [Glycine max]KRH46382.1 hypothetical protein GLYMA_08G330100v4 [Glycine max]|eukprot:XP_014634928.1 nudix hydrolase 10 isoform X4 [Glycine max]
MPVSASPAPLLGDRLCENGFECVKILPATNDAHGGVIVDLKEPLHSEVFATLLRSSLLHWKQQGKDGVWIKFPIELVNLVETAVKVLVVLEKKGGFHGIGVWKIPTGVVDAGEEIFEAAIREVKEETGIDTEFVELLAFRHTHNSFFGKSGLSFICMLRPLSFDIKKQELEIEAAQWMPFEEFADQPFNQMHEPFKYMIELCLAKVEKVYNGFSPRPISSYFVEELNYLYLNSHCLDKSS